MSFCFSDFSLYSSSYILVRILSLNFKLEIRDKVILLTLTYHCENRVVIDNAVCSTSTLVKVTSTKSFSNTESISSRNWKAGFEINPNIELVFGMIMHRSIALEVMAFSWTRYKF